MVVSGAGLQRCRSSRFWPTITLLLYAREERRGSFFFICLFIPSSSLLLARTGRKGVTRIFFVFPMSLLSFFDPLIDDRWAVLLPPCLPQSPICATRLRARAHTHRPRTTAPHTPPRLCHSKPSQEEGPSPECAGEARTQLLRPFEEFARLPLPHLLAALHELPVCMGIATERKQDGVIVGQIPVRGTAPWALILINGQLPAGSIGP